MNKIVSRSNLGYLGTEYQYKLVSSFINDPSFFVDLVSIIDQNTFTEQYLKKIVGIMKNYYDKYGSVPRYDMILMKMQEGAKTEEVAKASAKSVICSSLVKAAMFGADANWGRILCALGYAGVQIDVNKVDVRFKSEGGEILVCQNGVGVDFSEELAKEILVKDEIHILVNLNDGEFTAKAYGCDLTYDYVKINGDYRT